MEVCQITDSQQWNEFLIHHKHGHLLQSYEWGEVLNKLGGPIYRLGALENGRLVGTMMISVASVPFPLLGSRFRWLYCSRGPAVEEQCPAALAALVQHAHTIARKYRAVVLRVEPNIVEDDPEISFWQAAYQNLGFRPYLFSVHGRRSWVLDIRPDIKELLANFKMTWRQNVRSAERKGVIIREVASEADFDAYYELLKITSERDAFFIHSKEHHKEILQIFKSKGDAVLYLAEHEGTALAAKMLIRFGDWCWDMFGATSNEKRNLKPAYLLQYHCFVWAKDHGCTHFDFRTIPEKLEPGEDLWGVYQYKKGFGGYSRLNMPTMDYVYRPLPYFVWSKAVAMRRARHRKKTSASA